MSFFREMMGLGCIGAGVIILVMAALTRTGEGLLFLLVFGVLSLWAGYGILHGPRGGGSD